MKNRAVFIAAGLATWLIFFVLVLGITHITSASPKPTLGPDSNADLLKNLEQLAKRTDLPSELKKDIQARIDVLNTLSAERVGQYTGPAPRDPNQITPTNLPTRPYPEGIFENSSPPYHEFHVVISNCYQKIIDGKRLVIYAGHLATDEKQGAVMIYDVEVGMTEIYRTPDQSGNVRIKSANYGLVQLVRADGTTLEFDAIQRAFLVDGKTIKISPGVGTTPTPYPMP